MKGRGMIKKTFQTTEAIDISDEGKGGAADIAERQNASGSHLRHGLHLQHLGQLPLLGKRNKHVNITDYSILSTFIKYITYMIS